MLEIIREYSFDVNFETGKFKRTDGSEERIKLVQNDNESTKFKFNFEEEIADNTNVLVRLRQSTGYVKEYTMLIQNQEAEIILTNDILSESGSLTMSITLIGTDDEILTDTEYHSKIQVIASLEGNTEIPEQEKSVLVDLISQVNSLNQTASQLVEDSQTAVQNANTATTNANTATQNANTATSNANQAAQNANDAVTELDNRLAAKVDKVNGKDLSTNDYDNTEKEKNETNRTEILRRALVTETGNKIELEIDNSTYILTAKLYDKNNNLISTSTPIDLPLEAMVVSATYNSETKKVVLTLQSGSTTEFSIADLISGLVNEDTFNETIEELQEENEKLKEKNEELEKEIEELKDNELVYTVSGESIDIDDSANATIRNIKITGKSVQDGTPTPENPVEIQNCSSSINFKIQNSNGTQEQNITFPLQSGQVLAQDDYLADDGIHHNRKTIEITSENVNSLGLDCYKYAGNNCAYLGKRNLGWKSAWNSQVCLINKYQEITATSNLSSGKFSTNFVLGSLLIFDERFTSINVAKELLIGTIIEIKQAQEIIEPYTEQQAQVWKQIKALRTYKNITHINSEDETKPTLEVTYVRDLQTVINNMQAQILS